MPVTQVHAKDKPIPREGNAVWESDALLHRTAELTIGMAGADLANLLNEASILMVCPAHILTLPRSFLVSLRDLLVRDAPYMIQLAGPQLHMSSAA